MFFSKRVVLFSLLGIVLVSFASNLCLSLYFMHFMPSAAQPEVGRIYPFNQHGWIVYLTSREKLLDDISGLVLFVSGALLVVLRLFFLKNV